MRYIDFDILISRGPDGGYEIRAQSETHGEADGRLLLDVQTDDLVRDLRRLEGRETDRQFLQAFGGRLYQYLFDEDVDRLFQRSYGSIAGSDHDGVRLRLHIEPAGLSTLPWEMLYSAPDHAYLGTRIATPVVRYLRMNQLRRELATGLPLRLLVGIPHGEGAAELNVTAERDALERATDALGDDVEITYVHELYADGRVTWDRLAQCLGQRAYHCLHFIGHGLFRDDRGYLVLDAEDAGFDAVDEERFARLFSNAPTVKLVVLNACKGAAASSSRQLAGSAAKLVEAGVPAVVAMQFNILDPAAVDFSRTFYTSLFCSAEKGRVDVAVSRARNVLEAKYGDQRELAAPVLFMRSPEGVLFVPETGRLMADLPRSADELDTLHSAAEQTPLPEEADMLVRRIATAKRIARVSTAAVSLAFMLFYIGFLDLFSLDTRAEFLIMALGNALASHEVSDELQLVAIDCRTSSSRCGDGVDGIERRRDLIGRAISHLSAVGAGTIVLNAAFTAADDGAFKAHPASGAALADVIGASGAPVVVSSLRRDAMGLQVPVPLRNVAAEVGHGCVETKLGLARSLPLIATDDEGVARPSLALAAYARHRGGMILTQTERPGEVLISFPDRRDLALRASEWYRPFVDNESCNALVAGDLVVHRFIRFMPSPASGFGPQLMSDTELSQLMVEDPGALRARFSGKLVLLGLVGDDYMIPDRGGARDALFWHADALNSLLHGEPIIPMGDGWQLLGMLLLAAFAVWLRMRLDGRERAGQAVLSGVSAVLFAAPIYLYGVFNVLLNPAYHIIAMWAAWLLAGRVGKRWLG